MATDGLGLSASRNASLSPSDCCPGYILYLKGKEEILYEHFMSSGLQTGALNHPVLVIQKESSIPSRVHVCLVSELNRHTKPS